MLRVILIFLFVTVFFGMSQVFAQQTLNLDTIFIERFDSISSKWKMSTSSFPTNTNVSFFRETTVTRNNSSGAATDTAGNRTSSFLTTPNLKIDSNAIVRLFFDHICYIEGLDDGTVEYSVNSGARWKRIPSAFHYSRSGRSTYAHFSEDKFSKTSSPGLWRLGDTNFVWNATNSVNAWVSEAFEVDQIINFEGNPDSIMFRFGLYDDTVSAKGRVGTHQWYIDNVEVIASLVTEVEENESFDNIKLYPNPVTEVLLISSNNFIKNLTLFDVNGIEVLNKQVNHKSIIRLDLLSLPKGLYFIKLICDEDIRIERIMKN